MRRKMFLITILVALGFGISLSLFLLIGGAATMIITSVLAMAFDSLFVIIQRYNRPRLVKIMTRFQSIK